MKAISLPGNSGGQAMREIFKKLVELPGGSGFEEKVIEVMAAELGKRVPGVSIDSSGNVIGKLGTGEKSVMVCVHSDEVGMVVKYIDERGYVYFDLNGMIDERVLLSTKVDICTRKTVITGVVGVKSRHLMTADDLQRPVRLPDLWIDVGADHAEDVRTMGVEIQSGGLHRSDRSRRAIEKREDGFHPLPCCCCPGRDRVPGGKDCGSVTQP
jgi:putative aminopeptidase FrvX